MRKLIIFLAEFGINMLPVLACFLLIPLFLFLFLPKTCAESLLFILSIPCTVVAVWMIVAFFYFHFPE